MGSVSLLRYPGSKDKLWVYIKDRLPDNIRLELGSFANPCEYREPFVGSGAIALRVLEIIDPSCKVWLNDKDLWLVCLWNAVKNAPDELCEEIDRFTPTPQAFIQFKSEDGNKNADPVTAGFKKLAIHQMSVSGFGAMAGSVIGGVNQTNPLYTVSCRWNPILIKRKIRKASKLLKRFRRLQITCRDCLELVRDLPRGSFTYLDPPYVEKGPSLYKHAMREECHRSLAEHLRSAQGNWLLSYDDHALIRQLYSDCEITEIAVKYSNATGVTSHRPKNHEILIAPRGS